MSGSAKKTVTFSSGKEYALDRFGYLEQPEEWSEDFADGMARLQGVYDGLTEEHWSLINYIRGKFLNENDLPLMVMACHDNNLRLSKMRELFPTGFLRGACRISGLNFEFLCKVNIWHTYESARRIENDYPVTEQGFLIDFTKWDKRFAKLIGVEWELPEGLTGKHWEIVRFLRNYYAATNNIPTVYEVCQAHQLELDDLKELFPGGYRRGACRIAGLPFFA